MLNGKILNVKMSETVIPNLNLPLLGACQADEDILISAIWKPTFCCSTFCDKIVEQFSGLTEYRSECVEKSFFYRYLLDCLIELIFEEYLI
jgi:hypothetical protein